MLNCCAELSSRQLGVPWVQSGMVWGLLPVSRWEAVGWSGVATCQSYTSGIQREYVGMPANSTDHVSRIRSQSDCVWMPSRRDGRLWHLWWDRSWLQLEILECRL